MVSSGISSGAIAGPDCGLGCEALAGRLGGFGFYRSGLLRDFLGGHFLLSFDFLALRWGENLLGLGERVDLVLAWDFGVGGENETYREAGQLLVRQSIHY